MLMKYVLLYLCIHDPGHRAKPGLEADQVKAEPNQDHGGVLGRATNTFGLGPVVGQLNRNRIIFSYW